MRDLEEVDQMAEQQLEHSDMKCGRREREIKGVKWRDCGMAEVERREK